MSRLLVLSLLLSLFACVSFAEHKLVKPCVPITQEVEGSVYAETAWNLAPAVNDVTRSRANYQCEDGTVTVIAFDARSEKEASETVTFVGFMLWSDTKGPTKINPDEVMIKGKVVKVISGVGTVSFANSLRTEGYTPFRGKVHTTSSSSMEHDHHHSHTRRRKSRLH